MRALHEGRYGDFRPLGYDEAEFLQRADAALHAIFDRWPVERVVAVAHGGIINAMLDVVLRPRDGFFFVHLAYASFSVIERVPAGRMVVRSVNETGHLLADRRPGSRRPVVLDG
jgi:probable phosphoglycerate mutase